MANVKSEKSVLTQKYLSSPAQVFAKKIADGIKDKKIVMGKAIAVTGKAKDGAAITGQKFASAALSTGAVIEVSKTETKGVKNAAYVIKLTKDGTVQKFSGFHARRAYNLLTAVPKVRATAMTSETKKFCEDSLKCLGI